MDEPQNLLGPSPLCGLLKELLFVRMLEQYRRNFMEFHHTYTGKAFAQVRPRMDAHAQELGFQDASEMSPDQRRQAYFNAVLEAGEEILEGA